MTSMDVSRYPGRGLRGWLGFLLAVILCLFALKMQLSCFRLHLFLLVPDAWAVREGVWSFSETYTTGIHVLGTTLDRFLFYTVITVLVVPANILGLRLTEILVQNEPAGVPIARGFLQQLVRRMKLQE